MGADMAVLLLAVTSILIWWAVTADRRDRNWPCHTCGHRRADHVSSRDWDSDFGDPEHLGPHYMMPGLCRRCKCLWFVPADPPVPGKKPGTAR
jgi:hypothetical protein